MRDLMLWNVDHEDPILALGLDALLVGVVRQCEASREAAVEPLDAVYLLVVFALFLLALTGERQHALLDRDVEVVLADLRQLGLDEVLGVGLADVGRRRPVVNPALVVRNPRPPPHGIGKDTLKHVVDVPKWFPLDYSHLAVSWWRPPCRDPCMGP